MGQAYPFCLGMGLLFAGVLVLAAVLKWREVYRARSWQATPGVVIKARVRSKKRYDQDGSSSIENEPLVTYEYQVGGQTYRASRLSFAERVSGQELLGMLKRYPVGRAVTVHYNPEDPAEAVLEKDMPAILWWGIGLLALGFIVVFTLMPVVFGGTADWLTGWIPKPENAIFVTLAAAMGLGCLLLTYALVRQVQVSQSWLAVQGKILSAETEAYQEQSGKRQTSMYRTKVIYAYTVAGQQFLGDRLDFGGSVSWSTPILLRRSLQRYPEDTPVTVYYDPESPDQAVLQRSLGSWWFLLLIAAGLFLLAAWAGGWI